MSKKVSIILINYNWLAFNKECIDSLLLQTYSNFEIVFVDNVSTDGSVAQVENMFADIITDGKLKIVKSRENNGFSQWNNMGVLYADPKSEYICLLNNDTIVEKDWLAALVAGIESDSSLGGVGSLILDRWYEEYFKNTIFRDKKIGLNNYIMEPVFRTISQSELEKWVIYTTWLSGCSYLYKRELIDKPFIDFFFWYGEDTYLSFCILLQWHKLALCTDSIVHHYGSGSFWKKITVSKAFHGVKNQLTNIIVFHSFSNILKLFPVFLLFQIIKTCSSHPFTRFLGFWKAIFRSIAHMPEILRERKKVQMWMKISYKEFLAKLSPKMLENTYYFITLPPYQIKILNLINRLCAWYFYLVKIR